MLIVRRLGPSAILVASSLALATVIEAQRPPASEREAMYNRFLEFASCVKGGSITPHWLADGSSFWYAEGTPSNTVIWKVDPKANIKTFFYGATLRRPDRRWFAGTKDHNLWLRPADGGTSLQLGSLSRRTTEPPRLIAKA